MSDTATAAAPAKNPVTRMFGYVGIVGPAIVTLVALWAQLRWLADTPDPLAVHWGLDGADAAGPRWVYPLFTLVLGFGLPLWLCLSALPRLRRGSRGWSFRFLAALALGLSLFSAVAFSWAVASQVGLDSWEEAPNILPGILVGLLAGVLVGLGGWFIQPRQATQFEELPQATVALGDNERAVWLGVAKAGRGVIALMVSVVVLLFGGAAGAWLAGAFSLMWILLGAALVVGFLGLATLEADVRVDADGVEVRGPAGWPRSRVPLAEVGHASAITVEALGAFGGWGWRRVPGALGVVLRSGEALRVERTQGHALVVTVDDAATAAALLMALRERAGA